MSDLDFVEKTAREVLSAKSLDLVQVMRLAANVLCLVDELRKEQEPADEPEAAPTPAPMPAQVPTLPAGAGLTIQDAKPPAFRVTMPPDGIGRLEQCIKEGRHVKLNLDMNDPSAGVNIELTNRQTGRVFARMFLCNRCGLAFWELSQ